MVDELLYDHYRERFDALVDQLPESQRGTGAFDGLPKAKVWCYTAVLLILCTDCVNIAGQNAHYR